MKNKQDHLAEIVVYRLKGDAIPSVSMQKDQVNHTLGSFEGFVSRQVYQSINAPHLFFDYVIWNSLEEAQRAAQAFPQHESLRPFAQTIDSTVAFGHYQFDRFAGTYPASLSSEVVELVLYSVRSDQLAEVPRIFDIISQELSHTEGFRYRVSGAAPGHANQFADLLVWQDAATARASMALMESNPRVQPFFAMNEETTLFEHFKVFR